MVVVNILLMPLIISTLVMTSSIRPHVLIPISRMVLLRGNIDILLNVPSQCCHTQTSLCPISLMQFLLLLISLTNFPLLYFTTNPLGRSYSNLNQISYTLELLVVHASLFLDPIIKINFNYTQHLASFLALQHIPNGIFVQTVIHFRFTYQGMSYSMNLSFQLLIHLFTCWFFL